MGGLLLLLGGDGSFARIVPWLVLLSSLALLVQPRITKVRGEVDQPRAYLAGLLVTCIYGGYFGAGAGVVFLVLALLTTTVGFPRSMMLKSMLLAVSNLAASLVFVVAAPVDWWAAVATGIGCFVGGRMGPRVQRLVPQWLLRGAVALGGAGLAVWLWASS